MPPELPSQEYRPKVGGKPVNYIQQMPSYHNSTEGALRPEFHEIIECVSVPHQLS
jgi:hypothetical protein